MKKIFIKSSDNFPGEIISVTGDDYHHLVRSLRVQIGEKFLVSNAEREFFGEVLKIDKDKIEIILSDYTNRESLNLPQVDLYFSLLKGEKNENVIRQCSEIGIVNFYPVLTKNCIVKPESGNLKKIERWRKIASESAKQAGRISIPNVNEVISFKDISLYSSESFKIFGHIGNNNKNIFEILKENDKLKKFSVFIGPEGDFTDDEIEVLIDSGWNGVNVSPYIFKSDTAAVFFASLVFGFFWK